MRDMYKIEDLWYAVCFEAKDKFLVGPVNNKRTKIKDANSSEIMELRKITSYYGTLGSCSEGDLLAIMNGVNKIRGLETSLYNVSIMQKIHAKQIRRLIDKDVLSTRDISTIKSIMNSEIEKSQSREASSLRRFQDKYNRLQERETRKEHKEMERVSKENLYSMTEEEKEF